MRLVLNPTPDVRLRRLERLVATGDAEALDRLRRERHRLGLPRYGEADWPWPHDSTRGPSFAPLLYHPPGRERRGKIVESVSADYSIRSGFEVEWIEAEPAPDMPAVDPAGLPRYPAPNERTRPYDWEIAYYEGPGRRFSRWEGSPWPWQLVLVFHIANGDELHMPFFGPGIGDVPLQDTAHARAWKFIDVKSLHGIPVAWFSIGKVNTIAGAGNRKIRSQVAQEYDRFADRMIAEGRRSGDERHPAELELPPPDAIFENDLEEPWNMAFYPLWILRTAREADPEAVPNMLPEDGPGPRWMPDRHRLREGEHWELVQRWGDSGAPLWDQVADRVEWLDSLEPDRRRRMTLWSGSNSRPARRLFPSSPRGFTQAAKILQRYARAPSHEEALRWLEVLRREFGPEEKLGPLPAQTILPEDVRVGYWIRPATSVQGRAQHGVRVLEIVPPSGRRRTWTFRGQHRSLRVRPGQVLDTR